MKEKEKAIELYNLFVQMPYPIDTERAKACALVLVDEMIKENIRYDYLPFENSRTEFLLKVRNEIEQL